MKERDHIFLDNAHSAALFPGLNWRNPVFLAHISLDLFSALAGLMW